MRLYSVYYKYVDSKQPKGFTNSKTSKENCIEKSQLSGTTKYVEKRAVYRYVIN